MKELIQRIYTQPLLVPNNSVLIKFYETTRDVLPKNMKLPSIHQNFSINTYVPCITGNEARKLTLT